MSINQRILNKTEATGSFPDFIQAHDDALYVSTATKQLMDLFLRGVE